MPSTPAGNLVERLKGTDPNSAYTDYVSDTAVYDSYGQLRVCAATGPVVRSAPAYLILRRTYLHYALDVMASLYRIPKAWRSSEPGALSPSRAAHQVTSLQRSGPVGSASVFSSTPRNASPPAPPRKREEEQA